MFASVEEFVQELLELQSLFLPQARLETVYSRLDKVSFRLVIRASLFIDIYFNAENGRFDFTLISDQRRVFGYDNLLNWHFHPVADPDNHVDCDEPSLRKIFQDTVETLASLH